MTVTKPFLIVFIAIATALSADAQKSSVPYNLYELNRQGKMEVFNRTLESINDQGHQAIRLSENTGDGVAWITGAEFANGTIELDIKGKDVLQQSFVGVAFHGVDDKTFDAVYFRPFNFKAADPVRRIHAVQYISNPQFTWNKLREEKNGMYEKEVNPAPDPNEWFHARIVINYPDISVYVNQNAAPCLQVQQIRDRKNGKIGLWVGFNSGGDFANLVITPK